MAAVKSGSIQALPLLLLGAALSLLFPTGARSQTKTPDGQTVFENTVQFDKTVHDFGNVLLSDGPLVCSFTVKNVSSKPIAISGVTSSCGCTNVTWTREPLAPGKSGTISATFSNDQGPYPFDKTLTVSIAGVRDQIVVRLRGNVHEKKKTLSEMYPKQFGSFAMEQTDIKLGNLSQGAVKSDAAFVANIGKSPIKVEFKDVSEFLELSVSPNPIPAGQTAKISYTVTASRERWGKNYYYATPVVDGKAYAKDAIGIWAVTKEDFSSMSKEEKAKGALPKFKSSSYSFDVISPGKVIEAEYELQNEGKSDLVIYKVDTDMPDKTRTYPVPTVKAGGSGKVKVSLDTKDLPKGETLVIITLTTNSPLRPIVNLFITGAIK